MARRGAPTKADLVLLAAGVGSLVNARTLRRRAQALPVLVDTDEPVRDDHVFVTAAGVRLDDATRRAASAHLAAEGLEVLDLLPGDLPVERALDVLRGLDPATYRGERTAVVRTAAQAMVVAKDVVRRAGIAEVDGLDVAAFREAGVGDEARRRPAPPTSRSRRAWWPPPSRHASATAASRRCRRSRCRVRCSSSPSRR